MRKVVLTVLVMVAAYLHSIAQSVGIGTSNAKPISSIRY